MHCPTPNKIASPCPPRYYCPKRGTVAPIICQAGTYNPNFGAQKCLICPQGKICPREGLLFPEPCPRGYACDDNGLIFAEKRCPNNAVCESEKGVKLSKSLKSCRSMHIVDVLTNNCDG